VNARLVGMSVFAAALALAPDVALAKTTERLDGSELASHAEVGAFFNRASSDVSGSADSFTVGAVANVSLFDPERTTALRGLLGVDAHLQGGFNLTAGSPAFYGRAALPIALFSNDVFVLAAGLGADMGAIGSSGRFGVVLAARAYATAFGIRARLEFDRGVSERPGDSMHFFRFVAGQDHGLRGGIHARFWTTTSVNGSTAVQSSEVGAMLMWAL